MKISVIKECDFVEVGSLKIGEIFYCDFDNFVFFTSTNKRYVESFEGEDAIVQCLHRNPDNSWGLNIRTKYKKTDKVYVFRGEHVAIYPETKI